MKKLIGLLLIIGMVLFIWGCNTPGGNIDDGGEAEEATFDWGDTGVSTTEFSGSSEWLGQSFPLSGASTITGGSLKSINLYSAIIIDALLYDMDDELIEERISDLAQFALLPGEGGDWENDKLAKGDNMATGETTASPISGKTEVPTHFLLEVHRKAGLAKQVSKITVKSITFIPGDIVLKHIFGESAVIEGTKIVFTNASYADDTKNDPNNWDGTTGVGSAVLLVFPADWGNGDALEGKTISINYTIEKHTCYVGTSNVDPSTVEHQINLQAAQDTPAKDQFNGQNPSSSNGNVGQKYPTLDTNETSTGLSVVYDSATGNGTLTISADDLIAASHANISGTDGNGPFTLDAVRFSNNGTAWTNSGTTHYRCKTYNLVINSIDIK
jgi:hypothetical protein